MSAPNQHMQNIGRENRRRVYNWGAHNPWGTAKQCAYDLGLAEVTVRRHVVQIRAKRNRQELEQNGRLNPPTE